VTIQSLMSMTRVKCKKCCNVFEQGFGGAVLAPHIGPLHYVKCPACGKRSWLNIYSSVKDPVTWSSEKKQPLFAASELTEEEKEKKRIEESKYERP
jgi:NAD-dependent SIR2 family protein deacetylase